jgi:hypothetical protein
MLRADGLCREERRGVEKEKGEQNGVWNFPEFAKGVAYHNIHALRSKLWDVPPVRRNQALHASTALTLALSRRERGP